jgi:Tfp pilus assembly protein PilF
VLPDEVRGGAVERTIQVSLACALLAAGRDDDAGKLLEAADAGAGHGMARLVRGFLAERAGDAQQALTHYDDAVRLLDPRAGEASYQKAFALGAAGDAEGAERALLSAVTGGYDIQLAVRALVDLARGAGDPTEEVRLLELLHRVVAEPSVELQFALGRAYLAQNRVEEGEALFRRGLEQDPTNLDCQAGLAYCAYVRDDRGVAKGLFEQILKVNGGHAWARQGLKNLEEARTRRVWVDLMDRPKGDVLNGWRVEAPYGLTAGLDGSRLVFGGSQANQAGGKTRVLRTVAGEQVVKFEVELVSLADNAVRCGIRFESRSGKAVLFREPQGGRLMLSVAKGNAGFNDATDLGPWPGAGAHTLAIDVEDPRKGVVAFLLDGQRRGEAKLGGFGRQRGGVDLVIYAQGPELGDQARFAVQAARVYVLRGPRSGGSKDGGGF